MKLDRLLAITVYLLNRRRITAGELADAFEVSLRTIYRDLETINLAGIPIVAYQGTGGGYGIDERLTMNRGAFRPEELKTLVRMLKGVNLALRDGKLESTIEKIHAIVPESLPSGQEDAIVLDFTPWGGGQAVLEKVALFRRAIETTRLASFNYFNLKGENIRGTVEPIVLILKGFTWYLCAHCRYRGGCRLFRLSRISSAVLEADRYRMREIDLSDRHWEKEWDDPKTVRLRMMIDAAARGRVEELFSSQATTWHEDGTGVNIPPVGSGGTLQQR
jgi:predicted DNA-binding transcriptional regulator YafY